MPLPGESRALTLPSPVSFTRWFGAIMETKHNHHKKIDRDALVKFLRKYGQSMLTGILFFVLVLLLCSIFNLLPGPLADQPPDNATGVSFEIFVSQIKTGNMRVVTIQGSELTANLARSLRGRACGASSATSPTNGVFGSSDGLAQDDPTCTIYVNAPAQSTEALLPMLLHAGVTVKTQPAQPALFPLLRLFCIVALAMILLVVVEYFFRRNRNSTSPPDQYSQFLKSRARRVTGTLSHAPTGSAPASSPGAERSPLTSARSTSQVRFTDVAGIDEARAELEEVVQFLRYPERFQRLGAHMPSGILLAGPPGTGKTLLARAVAGEAGVPFFHMSASEFVEVFVGVGASRVRDLFQQARRSAPCVVFLDEIDAVGRKRSLRPTDSGERDQTLNQLLIELDGFKSRSSVVVLAATNRLDMLDAALLRPGRFDRHITIPLPDRAGREAILRIHTRHTPLDAGVRLDHLARLTVGMSGAELANLVNEAALYAARHNLTSLTPECFKEALARLQLGVQRSLVVSEREQRMIAFHECGHALVAFYVPEAVPVNSITLLARGRHLGITQFAPQEDRYNLSKAALLARIAVRLGGRVAVELAFGPEEITTRAEDDLQAATALAWRMVTRWGMGKQTGVVFADYEGSMPSSVASQAAHFVTSASQEVSRIEPSSLPAQSKSALLERSFAESMARLHSTSSSSMAAMIDDEVRHIVEEGREAAYLVLREHYSQLTHLVDILMEQEQLERQQVESLLSELR